MWGENATPSSETQKLSTSVLKVMVRVTETDDRLGTEKARRHDGAELSTKGGLRRRQDFQKIRSWEL